MAALNLLPNELLKKILWHLDKEDTKSFAATSKRLNTVALPKLWSKPRYHEELKDMNFLNNIQHLPIEEVNLVDFDVPCWIKIAEVMPNLKHVTIDRYLYCEEFIEPIDLKVFKDIPMVLHTNAVKVTQKKHLIQLAKVLETCNVKEMIVDHIHRKRETQLLWPSDALSTFVGKVKISKLYTDCIGIGGKNKRSSVTEFIKSLAKFKDCRVIMPGTQKGIYEYTVEDLELMADLDINLVSIMSGAWENIGMNRLEPYLRVLKRFKYLEDVHLGHEWVIEPPQADELVGLPFTIMSTHHVLLEGEDLEDVVDTLCQIKTLKWFYIVKGIWLYVQHKLTPDEFVLFKRLPVKLVHIATLDLTRETVPIFRDIMRTMEIEEFQWFEKNDDLPDDYDNLGISEKRFGPDDAYRTI